MIAFACAAAMCMTVSSSALHDTCADVLVVDSSHPHLADGWARTFRDEVDRHNDEFGIVGALQAQHGGEWELLSLGQGAFSYSVTCNAYVEMASTTSSVLMCRVGEEGLPMITRNGTTWASHGDSADDITDVAVRLYRSLDGDNIARQANITRIKALMYNATRADIFDKDGARNIQSMVEREFRTVYSVFVEEVASGMNIYSAREQFNLDVKSASGLRSQIVVFRRD